MLVRSLPAAAAAAVFILSHQAAVAQPAPASPAAQAAISPAQAAAQAAFERLDEAERKAIQNDLIWSGDFNGVAGGEFGRRTFDAIRAFERRVQAAEDGILSPPERARLKQAADQARAGLRFATVTDQATGIAIGMPQSILTQRVAVDGGVVYRRQDGQVSLLLQRLPPQPIAELFERLRQDGPNRKVTYRLQRPDWFVLSGDEGARKRVAQGASPAPLHLPLSAAESREMDRLMIAIANTFDPFPGTAVANAPPRPPQQPGAAPQTPPPLVRSTEARHAVSGVVVAPGKVLTSAAALKSCGEPAIGGQAVAAGAGQGELTILSVATGQQPAVALAAARSPARSTRSASRRPRSAARCSRLPAWKRARPCASTPRCSSRRAARRRSTPGARWSPW